MAAQDFAYSVIGATRLKHLDQYLDKVCLGFLPA